MCRYIRNASTHKKNNYINIWIHLIHYIYTFCKPCRDFLNSLTYFLHIFGINISRLIDLNYYGIYAVCNLFESCLVGCKFFVRQLNYGSGKNRVENIFRHRAKTAFLRVLFQLGITTIECGILFFDVENIIHSLFFISSISFGNKSFFIIVLL